MILVVLQVFVAAGFRFLTYGLAAVIEIVRDDVSGGLAFLFELAAETAGAWFLVLLFRMARYARSL